MIAPLLPPPSKMGRRPITNPREVFNALQFMLGTGCQWRAIPKCFPPFRTVPNDEYAWRNTGVFERMLEALRDPSREQDGRSQDPTAAAIDRPSVATTESGGPAGSDAGKKIKGRKRPRTVDPQGSPMSIRVHEASVPDRDGAPEGIRKMREKAPKVTKVWADGGDQGPKLASALADLGSDIVLEIVRKPPKVQSFILLYRRWVVERTFAWRSRCRRLAKDYEHSLASSLAWVQRAAGRFRRRRVARAGL